jgi:hypothetical protein
MRNIIAAVALVAVFAAPAVAFGAQSHHAYAQAPDSGEESHMSSDRVQALKDCTAREQQFNQVTFGNKQLAVYRQCMMEHHQPE